KSFPLKIEIIKKEGGSLHERKIKRKDGTIAETEVNVRLLENIGYISIIRDITERKKAEHAIKESEEKYRHLFKNSPANIIIWDPETLRILEVNDSVFDKYGYSKEEWENMSVLDYRRKEDHEIIRGFAKRLLELDEPIKRRRWEHLKKNGEAMQMEIESHKIIYNNRNAILSLALDVTEQVNAQNALRKTEECFRSLIDHAADSIFMVDDSGIIFDVNLSASQLLYYTKDEFIGMSVLNLYPSDVRQNVPKLWDELRKNKSLINETKLFRKDGTSVEVEISRNMLPDGSGAIAIVRDITERKKAEKKLKQSEARLKEAQAVALMGSWEIDMVKNIHIWSDELYNIFGVKKEEVKPSAETFLSLMYPDDAIIAQREIEKIFLTSNESTADFRFLGKDGSKRYAHIEWRFDLDENKHPVRLYGTLQDITERIKAEKSIKQSEANYRQLFDLSPEPMWVIDEKDYKFIQVNKACIDNYGYSLEEFTGGMTIKDISPNYNEIDTENNATKKNRINPFFIGEQKHVKKSGELLDVITSSMPIVLNGEKKTLMIAIDVTEKNRYEQKLTRAAIKAQEEERYEIGGELHDNVCQILATSLMYLGLMKKKLQAESTELFNQTHQHITEALNEIRNLSHRLAPAFFDNTTLEDTFKYLLTSFNIEKKYEIELYFDNTAKNYPLSRELQLNLYRILQEQLRNILKHAKATRIEVEATINNNVFQMRIADNGVGFNNEIGKAGIGLANMNRRAQLFSGKFAIKNAGVGKGCEVLTEIPLANNN
ncbi:MAG: PAS domain S-box protein, partial [Bacteroidota bacterium]|nr:PAS domain S-box protein [Bacteroidota bacterium]